MTKFYNLGNYSRFKDHDDISESVRPCQSPFEDRQTNTKGKSVV